MCRTSTFDRTLTRAGKLFQERMPRVFTISNQYPHIAEAVEIAEDAFIKFNGQTPRIKLTKHLFHLV
jgi:hypothetical protein